jgi:hypothetical protein
MGTYTITVTPLVNGTSYTIDVTATNANGTGLPGVSNAGVPAGVPNAPTSVVATAGNAQATVTFVSPANNGSAITSYTATASPGGAMVSGTASPLTVAGLTNGTAYTIAVTATNAVGTGPAGTSNSVTPVAPGGFVITSTSPLTAGTQGVAYTATVTAGGGTSVPPYSYFTTGNVAPAPGLTLATNGTISGTPTTAGTYVEPYYATDSSGGPGGYPSTTTIATNNGSGNVQTPGGISTTSSAVVIAGEPMALLTTVATYAGLHAPPGLQSAPTDTFVNQTSWVGPTSSAAGTPINASQETVLWTCASPLGGTTTYQQWFGPDGYGGANPGDQDYQAFKAYQYSAGASITGIGAFTAQTGTNYAGVANGTVLQSGTITLTSTQVPCTLFGYCINQSEFGSPYAPSVGTVAGASAGTLIENTWPFGSAATYPTLRQIVFQDPNPSHGGASSYSATFTENTLAGSTIVVAATVSFFAGTTVESVSDPVNGNYTLANDTRSAGNQDVAIYYFENAGILSTTTAITETLTAFDDYYGLVIMEWTGVPATGAIANASGGISTTTGSTANNIVTPSVNMGTTPITLVAFISNTTGNSNPAVATVGSGFTSLGTGWIWNYAQPYLLVESKNLLDPGTVASTAQSSGADTFIAQQIGIVGTAGGSPLATYASWNITTAGTYAATFVNNSGAANCYQTVGWTVQLPSGTDQTTPVKDLSITIASGGGGGVPSAPTSVTAYAETGGVSVRFGPPTSAGSSAVTGYIATASTGQSVTLDSVLVAVSGAAAFSVPARRILIPGVPTGSPVTVTVQAINSSGTGPGTTSNSVTPVAVPAIYYSVPGVQNSGWGDFSYGGTVTYGATPPVPNPVTPSNLAAECPSGTGFLPYFIHANPTITNNAGTQGRFDLSPYNYLQYYILPTGTTGGVQHYFERGIWVDGVITGYASNVVSDSSMNFPTNGLISSGATYVLDVNNQQLLTFGATSNTATTINIGTNTPTFTAPSVGHYYEVEVPDQETGQYVYIGNGSVPAGVTAPATFVVGAWNFVKIPLSLFNGGTTAYPQVTGTSILKYGTQTVDNATFYICQMGFSVD